MKTSKVYYTDDALMSPQLSILEGQRTLIGETSAFPIYLESRRTVGLVAYPDVREGQLVLPFSSNFWAASFHPFAPIKNLRAYVCAATFVASVRNLVNRYDEKTRVSIFDFAKWKLYAPELEVDDLNLVPGSALRLDAAHGKIMGDLSVIYDDEGRSYIPMSRQKEVCSFALWTGQPAFLTYEHAFEILESLAFKEEAMLNIKGKIDSAPAEYTFISFNR